MRTIDEALDQFAYHPATAETAAVHDALRSATAAFTERVWPLIPDGPEKTLALRGLQTFLMYANLAVALTAPVDHHTAAIARVLPGTSGS